MSDTVRTKYDPAFPSIELPVNDLEQTFTYSGSLVETITVEYQGVTYVQTFANDGVNITSISQWEPQA